MSEATMKFTDHLLRLEDITEDNMILTMRPGPFKIAVGEADGQAAKLLTWLETQMPDSATVGEMSDVLHAALWWLELFSAMAKADSLEAQEDAALEDVLTRAGFQKVC